MWHKEKNKIICMKITECGILKEASDSRMLYSKTGFIFLKEASIEGALYHF